MAAPAKCRREPAEHDAAETLGARAAAAPRRAIERLNCLSMTQGQQYFADGMPIESEAQTSGVALRLGFEAWEGRSEMEVALGLLVQAAAAGGDGKMTARRRR